MRLPFLIAGFLLASGHPDPAAAQTRPKLEIAGGYAFLSAPQLDASFPIGWTATVERPVTDRLAIAVEFGHHRDRSAYEANGAITTSGTCSFFCLGRPPDRVLMSVRSVGERTLNNFSLLGGLRYRRSSGRVAPFAHVLAGLVAVRWDFNGREYFVDYVDPNSPVSVTPEQLVPSVLLTRTRFATELGAGVEFPSRRRARARVGAAFRRVFDVFGFEYLNQYRVGVEVVVGVGGRR